MARTAACLEIRASWLLAGCDKISLGFAGPRPGEGCKNGNLRAWAHSRRASTNVRFSADYVCFKDSLKRQREAVEEYARRAGLDVVRTFNDPAVSGSDPINERPGFVELLAYLTSNGAKVVLVENPSRFARDLAIQIAGHDLLRDRGIALIPVDAPDYFTDETPTAIMVRQILGAVSQFEKASLVQKLRKARERKRDATGRCEGWPPVPEHVKREARRLARRSPKTGKRRSLRKIAVELAALEHVGPSGRPYGPESVKRMLA